MEIRKKFVLKASFEKLFAFGIGYESHSGLVIILPFCIIGIGMHSIPTKL